MKRTSSSPTTAYSDEVSWPHCQAVYTWPVLKNAWGARRAFPDIQIDLVRHGETVYNRESLVTGTADVQLSDQGKCQAIDLGGQLSPPYELLFSSRLVRSVDTLRLAISAAGIDRPVIQDWRLNERSLGAMEGKPWQFIPELSAGDLGYAPPGGEPYRHVIQRCLSFLLDLHRAAHDWPDGRRILVCTHVGPLRVFFGLLYNEHDSARMLSLDWHNTVVIRAVANSVPWPRFLEPHGDL
jgi:broad specificity phosphatase PhoE